MRIKGQVIRALTGWGGIALLLLAYLAIPPLRAWVNGASALLFSGDIPGLKAHLLSFGAFAPAVSAALMILQSLIVPLPAFVISVTNGLLFGALWGFLLSWASLMAAASLSFGIGRLLGRPVVEALVGRRVLTATDRFFYRYGKYAVLLGRFLPLVSFDAVSYVAGLTAMPFWEFLAATGLDSIPGTLSYALLGQAFEAYGKKILMVGVPALSLLAAAFFYWQYQVHRRRVRDVKLP